MTWGQLRQTIIQGAGSGLPLPLVNTALNLGLEAIQASFGFPRTERQFTVPIAAPTSAGTVAVTKGSAAVTGTGTSWTTALNKFRFRLPLDNHFYTIAVSSSTALTLDRPYEGATATGAAYRIVQWFVQAQELTMDVRSVTSSFGGPMTPVSLNQVNEWDPFRSRRAPYPTHWFQLSDSTDRSPQTQELQQIGFWPEVTAGQSLQIIAPERIIPCSDESLDVTLPSWIHDGALISAALLNLLTIAPPLPDGSPRVDAGAVERQFARALEGMRAEVNRLPISRSLRGTPASENPCRFIV